MATDSASTVNTGAPAGEAPWAEVLRSVEDLRELFRDYTELMQDSWLPDSITDDKRTLILFHRGVFKTTPSPIEKLGRVADLYRRMSDVINKEEISFRIPTRSALVPESDNPELVAISRRFRELNGPLDRLIGQVYRLDPVGSADLEERTRSLLAGVAALFKGILRQDWDDVDLVMKHINLVTTSSKSRGLVHQMAQIARVIYNSLNEFSAEYSVEELSHSAQEIPDAVQKLRSVIKRLEEFANANLDALEQLNRDMAEDRHWIGDALQVVEGAVTELDSMAAADPSVAEDAGRIARGLANDVGRGFQTLLARIRENEEAALSLIGNMSFQDLTGQTLKKVIEFIEKLEFQLVGLIARHHADAPSVIKPETNIPLEGPDPKSRPALSQENVDKMLAELGF